MVINQNGVEPKKVISCLIENVLKDVKVMIEEVSNQWSTGKLEHPFGRGINFQIEVDSIEPILEN